MDTDQVFGKALTSVFIPEQINCPPFFFYKWVFYMCGTRRPLATYSCRLNESTKTNQGLMLLLLILENWTVMDSIICLDISEAPKGSITTQGLQVFQALLDLFPSKALPQKRCLRATSNPSLESGPDSCQLGTQAREGLGGDPVENLGIRFQNLRKLWFNLRYCFVCLMEEEKSKKQLR